MSPSVILFCIPINVTICYAGYRTIFPQEQDYCGKIQSLTQDQIRCVYAIDRLRCMEQLLAGKVDLGVFKAEDLLLASELKTTSESDQNLVITNEFRMYETQEHEFDMVTLVSNSPDVEINSLADLRYKRLCHPGFDEHGWLNDFSEIFLQYFEEMVVPEQCDPMLSVLENKINSTEFFFDSSCKPGPWSPESNIDQKLKLRYKRLCENCGDPSVCSHRDLYWGPQGAITCMLDCHGDVAWAKLQIVAYNFQKSTSCQDVSFLCLDGTKQPLNTTDPCIWISRPWPVILTRKATQDKVTALISYINNATLNDVESWEYAVRLILGNTLQPVHSVDPISLNDYLRKVPGFLSASEKKACRGSGQDIVIRICTENIEVLEKCNLMAMVANIYSIDPEFKCIFLEECLNNVANGKSDVLITSIENLRAVYEHDNLKVIMYQTMEDYSELRHSAAVVRNNSEVQSLADLKGKKACFTQYNGLGWNSVLIALNESSMIENICDGTKAMKEFFSDICIINHQRSDPVRACSENDNSTPFRSLHMNEADGLKCITQGGGDVAFIDQNYIPKYLEENKDAAWSKHDVNDFRSVCPERGVDSDCYLSRAAFGMVVVRKNIPIDRKEEIISAFLILSSLLGEKLNFNNMNTNYYYEPKILKLFSHYYNEKNVLFESSAGQLESTDQYFTRGRFSVRNVYEKNLQIFVDVCKEKERQANSIAIPIVISDFSVILCLFISLILKIN